MKSKRHALSEFYYRGTVLNIVPGSVLSIITDEGPVGVCGQSMSITSPHTTIHWYPSEDGYRARPPQPRPGKNTRERVVVVGDWSSPGPISLVEHRDTREDGCQRASFVDLMNTYCREEGVPECFHLSDDLRPYLDRLVSKLRQRAVVTKPKGREGI